MLSSHRPCTTGISIHAPREGGDKKRAARIGCPTISIHAPREGGDGDLPQQRIHMTISIHAPREGGDTGAELLHRIQDVISIHAPREGGDHRHRAGLGNRKGFQSTPPARGATIFIHRLPVKVGLFQSTPPARGATPPLTYT